MSGLPKKQQDRVNTFGVVLIGFVAAALTWVSVVALQAYYYSTAGDVEKQRGAENKGREVRDLKSKQRAELLESKFVDPKRGIVTIPIDTSMALVLRDLRGGAPSLVPAVGPHDLPTVPAVWGRAPDALPPAPAPGGATPAPAPGGATPAPAPGGATPAPAPGGATPAPAPAGAAPAPAPATPAPATPAPATPAPATPPSP